MPSKIRLQQIAERIREELSEMLIREVADPRLSGISVTDVKVDRELAWADIFVSAYEGQSRSKEVMEGLRSATGFLRRELAMRIDLRVFPRLRFHWDPTPERADHIERMLASLREEEANRPASAPADGPETADETDDLDETLDATGAEIDAAPDETQDHDE